MFQVLFDFQIILSKFWVTRSWAWLPISWTQSAYLWESITVHLCILNASNPINHSIKSHFQFAKTNNAKAPFERGFGSLPKMKGFWEKTRRQKDAYFIYYSAWTSVQFDTVLMLLVTISWTYSSSPCKQSTRGWSGRELKTATAHQLEKHQQLCWKRT